MSNQLPLSNRGAFSYEGSSHAFDKMCISGGVPIAMNNVEVIAIAIWIWIDGIPMDFSTIRSVHGLARSFRYVGTRMFVCGSRCTAITVIRHHTICWPP